MIKKKAYLKHIRDEFSPKADLATSIVASWTNLQVLVADERWRMYKVAVDPGKKLGLSITGGTVTRVREDSLCKKLVRVGDELIRIGEEVIAAESGYKTLHTSS